MEAFLHESTHSKQVKNTHSENSDRQLFTATMEECSVVRNKRIKPQHNDDRISALPDSVLQHILSLLPSTREAVRTSILSKRWQNQWTRVLVLLFEPSDGDKGFVENVLMLHDCPKIEKLHLEHHFQQDPRFAPKIRFAIRKCVEELILFSYDDESYLLPQFRFDCASMVRLKMVACHFMHSWTVYWPSLKSLEIDCRALSLDNDRSQCIANVVSGSPLLKSLEFRGTIGDRDAIVSKSLKKLSFVDVEIPAGVKVLCPNLEELHVLTDLWMGASFPDQMIENVLSGSPVIHTLELVNLTGFSNLVIASNSLKVLCLELHWEYDQPTKVDVSCPNLEILDILCLDEKFHAVNLSSSTEAAINYVYPRNSESVQGMLDQFEDADNLALESSFSWIISDVDVEVFLSMPILDIKCLTLNVGGYFGFALPGIAYALRLPLLETLVIKLNSKLHKHECEKDLPDLIISKLNNWFSDGSDGVTCLVSHLKTVKIIGLYEKDDKCMLELEFIEFLLKNARVLKKLIVILEKPGTGVAVEVSQELFSFPRRSQSASIELSCSS